MKLSPPDKLKPLLTDLGMSEQQAEKYRVKRRMSRAALIATLQEWWIDTRDVPRILARRSQQAYTDTRYQGLPPQPGEINGTGLTDDGRVDEPECVPADYQNVLVTESRKRFAEHRTQQQIEADAERDLQRVQAELRELAKRAAKMGVPVEQALGPIIKQIEAEHRELGEAA